MPYEYYHIIIDIVTKIKREDNFDTQTAPHITAVDVDFFHWVAGNLLDRHYHANASLAEALWPCLLR